MGGYTYPDVSLILFAKAPLPGLCKTRLIPCLGEQGAAMLQQDLLRQCVAQLCHEPLCHTQLWCDPDTTHPAFQRLSVEYRLDLYQQQGADLGERMYRAMRCQSADYTIIIGTDIPLLTKDYIEQAIKALQRGDDAVIGPAEDGGYVLLGLKQVDEALFEEIHWGTAAVFRETCEKMTAGGLSWHENAPLWDLDTVEDLRRYQRLKLP